MLKILLLFVFSFCVTLTDSNAAQDNHYLASLNGSII